MASEAFCETWSELEPSFAETQQGTDPSGSLTIGDLRQIAHGRVDYLLRLPASGDELVDEALGTIIARSEDALAQLDGKVEGAFAGPSEFNLVAGSPDGDSFNVLVEYLERECGFDVRLAR
jgi:hypothetical protein